MSPPSERDDGPHAPRWPGEQHGLTRRESEVLELAAQGLTNRQIADALFLNIETVKSHLKHAYHRLGVNDRLLAAARLHDEPFEPSTADGTAGSGPPSSPEDLAGLARRLARAVRATAVGWCRRVLVEIRTRRR